MRPRRQAFSLVELLVVIGIIAILLSLLLPVISTARRRAASTACLTRLRAIGQAMRIYAIDNRDCIPGAPSTSGKSIWVEAAGAFARAPGITSTNVPDNVIELFDYIGPLAQSMNIPLPVTSDPAPRFAAYRKLEQFMCPANGFDAAKAAGPASFESGPMLSYCTATAFLLLPPRVATAKNDPFAGLVTMPTGGSQTDASKWNFWATPPNYAPKLARVGPPASKIYCADSGRRLRGATTSVEFIYAPDSPYQDTLFSDFGPFFGITRSYDRTALNSASPAADPRIVAYRHGAQSPFGAAGAYLMNAVFFDGHAQTLDDTESANPALWLPTGSTIYRPTQRLNATDYTFWPDVAARYLPNVSETNPYSVP